ncbi:hypothetical protein ACLB2K_041589 [Fragaria x ananassa]
MDRASSSLCERLLSYWAEHEAYDKVHNPIARVDIGTEEAPLLFSISAKLTKKERETLLSLLREYKDCFAERYEDMSGLAPELVCHRLPTNLGCRRYNRTGYSSGLKK